jgi:molybdopterin converting factor small subunit
LNTNLQLNTNLLAQPMLSISLFAGMAEAAGCRRLEIPWSGGTVADLRAAVALAAPAIVPLLAKSAVAIGGRYARDEDTVAEGGDVAIIPPVSGG